MTPFDRGLLVLYSFLMTVFSSLLLLIVSGWWQQPLYLLWQSPYRTNWQLYLSVFIALVLVIGLRLFWVSVRHRQSGKAVVHDYMLGQVRISVLTIENLVKKVVYQIHGVKEVKPRVVQTSGGMGLHIRAVVSPDISIPEVSREIQQRVQDYVSHTTGLTVNEIKIMVDNISTTRPRVE